MRGGIQFLKSRGAISAPRQLQSGQGILRQAQNHRASVHQPKLRLARSVDSRRVFVRSVTAGPVFRYALLRPTSEQCHELFLVENRHAEFLRLFEF